MLSLVGECGQLSLAH